MRIYMLSLLLFFCSLSATWTQEKLEIASEVSLFNQLVNSEEKPILRFHTDTKKLIRKKLKEEYQSGVLEFELGEKSYQFDVEIRARGNVRKKVCYFPPLKIKFKKEQLVAAGFNKKHKLKLALQCRSSGFYEESIQKEYLIYRMYEKVDQPFIQTKLLQIELWNKGKRSKILDALLVEEESHFEQRNQMTVIESGRLGTNTLNKQQYLKMAFFQYMIANVDWAIINKHNVELVEFAKNHYISIPYDFDYCGLINNPYAVPNEKWGIGAVTERLFIPKKVNLEEALATADFYHLIRSDLEAVWLEADFLSDKAKRETLKFIDEFYKSLKNPKSIKKNFVRN